ncbi:EAL domain-containing protein [Neiella marina]|uniref:cyclic-guanylate-specific phosphodiesterase n=1 Tax=Neiella holothuriorum TaxID=2870530 RepID=A0ABS7EC07_9GAMM|nr:EAL domain-containing protein [Neiella holothuriorum]MBW8189503.1 EAL domain-containing protein [Neiella holothuriorum]
MTSKEITYTKKELASFFRLIGGTFICVWLLISAIVIWDIANELTEDAEELIERIEAVHYEGRALAKNLQGVSAAPCSEIHRKAMLKFLNQQAFIQAINYSAGNVACEVGTYAPFDTQRTLHHIEHFDLTINSLSARPEDIVGLEVNHGDYRFIYPSKVSAAFLLLNVDFELYFDAETVNQHLIGMPLEHRYYDEHASWWPDYALLVKSCSSNSAYCSILTYSPRQFLGVFIDWIGAISGIASLAAYLVYRLLKRRYQSRRDIGHRLLYGLENQGFYCQYQPIIELKTGKIVGCEVLARFRDDFGHLSPYHFIPEISAIKQTLPFTRLIVEQAISEINQVAESTSKQLKLNFNVFPQDFINDQFWAFVDEVSAKSHHLNLVVEITEDQPLDISESKRYTEQAQKNGIRIAMDDFGSGYSNLLSIQALNYDILKIDQSFIRGLENDAIVSSLLPNIIDISRKYELDVVAEGIEHEAQRDILIELGVQLGQGWLFGKPMSASDFKALLRDDRSE